jgi:hypothetical protein
LWCCLFPLKSTLREITLPDPRVVDRVVYRGPRLLDGIGRKSEKILARERIIAVQLGELVDYRLRVVPRSQATQGNQQCLGSVPLRGVLRWSHGAIVGLGALAAPEAGVR